MTVFSIEQNHGRKRDRFAEEKTGKGCRVEGVQGCSRVSSFSVYGNGILVEQRGPGQRGKIKSVERPDGEKKGVGGGGLGRLFFHAPRRNFDSKSRPLFRKEGGTNESEEPRHWIRNRGKDPGRGRLQWGFKTLIWGGEKKKERPLLGKLSDRSELGFLRSQDALIGGEAATGQGCIKVLISRS